MTVVKHPFLFNLTLEEGHLPCLAAPRAPFSVGVHCERQVPFDRAHIEQERLRRRETVLEQARVYHARQVPPIRLDGDGELREGLVLVLDEEVIAAAPATRSPVPVPGERMGGKLCNLCLPNTTFGAIDLAFLEPQWGSSSAVRIV